MPQDNLDPLRHIEGFPIGEDEDLHALSDPPHYTAYPNPHLAEFIEKWGTPYDEATDDYHREPYVADVSEGKNDPIYNAHSYHTKVPYKAIIPFIEHYTEPGDIVFDGFCGTGMTGVAAQMVGRRAVLCDLSPAATFIAYNYNTPVDVKAFEREAKRILKEVEAECGWMYETKHTDGRTGRINYTVWSDVFICPYCEGEIVFWEAAVIDGRVQNEFSCPGCSASLKKRELNRATEKFWDSALNAEFERARQQPVLINYSLPNSKEKYEKQPDRNDLAIVKKVESSEIPYWYPTIRIDRDIDLWYERDYRSLGIYAIHHLYFKRNLWMTAFLWNRVRQVEDIRLRNHLLFWLQSVTMGFSKLNRYLKNAFSQVNRILSGTLYVGSTLSEVSPWYALTGKIKRIGGAPGLSDLGEATITLQTTANIPILSDGLIDYIFTDPPFGSNIIYSDLSIIWESWLRIFTNTDHEAVVHRRKKEGNSLDDYRRMMTAAFAEMYRILKPGRWITVVFHNSRASVWNAIQEALAKAGFLVAQVTVMDKQQGSFKQVTAAGAVKNDLVINAYKPRSSFTQSFTSKAGQGLEAEFVRQHLEQLPKTANIERSKEMLYSKYLAYYVQHGYQVAYNGEQFYRVLPQWGFIEEDGYWFSDESQLESYQQALAAAEREAVPQPPLFVFDERSAIQWLKHFLHHHPSTLSEIQPDYLKALQTSADLIPDLRDLLAENFGQPDRQGRYHWPNPQLQAELDEARHNRLLRLFNDYLSQAQAGKRLKEVRKEALVTGFTEAYRDGRFRDILTVGHKLHKRLLEDNPDLFDFVDIAEAKVE
ncbi:MAG: DNA methylase [Anaerolineae bacterium]|nr:DNA methylase [Anaerolineae bacterium]